MLESSPHTDDELALSKITGTCVVEKNVLDSFAERLMMKIKARLGVEYLSDVSRDQLGNPKRKV
jgi:hypothetical protein